MIDIPEINLSAGNPRFCFKAAAHHACSIADNDMASYTTYSGKFLWQLLNQSSSLLKSLTGRDSDDLSLPDIAITHGTTQDYDIVLRLLSRRFNEFRQQTEKPDLKPVLVMATPTYGLFTQQPLELGYEIVHVKRRPQEDWRLDPQDLANTLAEIRSSGDRVAVAFFDSNPHNPTGLVRNLAETTALADIFCEHNRILKEQPCAKQTGPLHIIDDMVYYGLEYNENNRPISFMADARLQDTTYLLMGTSKIGLPAIRGGIVICNTLDAALINAAVVRNCDHPNVPAMRAVRYVFSPNADEERAQKQHLKMLRNAHMYGDYLLRSIVKGIPKSELQSASGHQLLKEVGDIVHNSQQAQSLLLDGIPGLEIMTKPQSGFFHLVKVKDQAKPLISTDIKTHFRKFGVFVCPGEWALCDDPHTMRLSYGVAPQEIIRGLMGMRQALHPKHDLKLHLSIT